MGAQAYGEEREAMGHERHEAEVATGRMKREEVEGRNLALAAAVSVPACNMSRIRVGRIRALRV